MVKPKLSPLRRKFIIAAIDDGNRIIKIASGFAAAGYWLAGPNGSRTVPGAIKLSDGSGGLLVTLRYIERVTEANSNNTQRIGGGYLYRVTAAGRIAAGLSAE